MVKADKDASSIWSGYIFKGNVAICRALEKINELQEAGEDICDTYQLKIEQEEDFSIITNLTQIFQVKAYTSHNYYNYAEAWKSLMSRYSDNANNNYLIIQKKNFFHKSVDFSQDDIPNKELLKSNIIDGVYTLENIRELTCSQISKIMGAAGMDANPENIELKHSYCCMQINDLIKRRHQTKKIEQILLKDILEWVKSSTIVTTEELAWYQAEKRLMDVLTDIALSLDCDEANEIEKIELSKVNKAISAIEALSKEEVKCLLKDNLSPHYPLNENNLLSFNGFINEESIRSVIGKAIRKIKVHINPTDFTYNINNVGENTLYQLTSHNGTYDITDRSDSRILQKECERISKSPICNDIDYFITGNLNISKEEVSKRIIESSKAPKEADDNNRKFARINDIEFGFVSVEKSIEEINNIEVGQ